MPEHFRPMPNVFVVVLNIEILDKLDDVHLLTHKKHSRSFALFRFIERDISNSLS